MAMPISTHMPPLTRHSTATPSWPYLVTDVTQPPPQKAYHFRMEKIKLELYTDYLICNNGFATATRLSAMIEGDISHDQMTHFLASKVFTSKALWGQVKPTVRQIEQDDG